MHMELEYKLLSGQIAVIEVIGEIDAYTAPRLRDLAIHLTNSGYFLQVLDLSRTEFTTSEGLGVIVSASKRARSRKGIVVVAGASERVLKMFRMTGLSRIFFIYESVSEAVKSIHTDSLKPGDRLDSGEFGSHWFQARIYASEEDAGPAVEKALSELLDTFGMEVVFGFSVEVSSWFREFILRMKNSTALPARDEALNLMKRAIEQQILDMPQSRIDVAQSQAVANLLVALEKTPNAVVQSGSVLVIKVRDVIVVRNLSQLELIHWERNPGLFRDPEKALYELQRAWDPTNVTDEPQDASSA